ncbi:hypothetical protein [Micromonospora sp. WMMD736]|uniref:hypothetical protein n=1 Tax=Micromonospora sp. WMMD736 TaxID=3404112 RepID=UPI003B940D24
MTNDLDARRRRIRTAFQAFVSACTVLLVIVPIAMVELEGALPANMYAYLTGAAAAVVAGATLVTRVMALPAVNAFIDRFVPWLSASSSEGSDA